MNLVAHALTSSALAQGTGHAPDELTYVVSPTLKGQRGKDGGGLSEQEPLHIDGPAVRRLSTVECSRLQGFPDDHFGEPNELPDGPRYAALGDAVTVPVAEWLGRRLMDAHLRARAA